MLRFVMRIAVSAVAGAALGAGLVALVYPSRAGVVLEFDRDPPPFTSGFHPAERAGDVTFAWTGPRAVLRLAGVDRHREWACTVRLRGARAGEMPQPAVVVAADGNEARPSVTNDFADVLLAVPARPDADGVTLSIASVPTFVPGPQDRRELGVQVDRVSCAPTSRWVRAPSRALGAAAIAVAGTGAALALGGAGLAASAIVLLTLALGYGLLVTTEGGAFGTFPARVQGIALAAAVVMAALMRAPELLRKTIGSEARFAIAIVSGAGALLLAALSHPGKDLVDAVFQAHRLEWVMAGRFFFTQPLPDGVAFPYAIGLYVVAAPWSVLTRDHVFLVRAVVIVAHAASALILYPLVAHFWGSRRGAVAAVGLALVAPLWFVVVGNANLPNAFGQSVALAAMAAIVATGAPAWRVAGPLAFAVLAALALLSHVSTLVLFAGMAGAAIVSVGLLGGRPGRSSAAALVLAMLLALGAAVGLYYRHFPEVYERALTRVRATTADAASPSADRARPELVRALSWPERARATFGETTANLGWPLLLLAVIGLVALARERPTDSLSVVIVGWTTAWLVALVAGTVTSVDVAFQRYALEFIGRVNLAGYPVAALLAARALLWTWRSGGSRPAALCTGVLLLWALAIGADRWHGWFSGTP